MFHLLELICTHTKEQKIIVLTTSFGLLLAGTTPAKHRQRDRESINDLLCSSLVPFDQQLPRTEIWTLVPAAEESATDPALSLSSSSCSSLLLSLSEQHTALGCSLIQVISSPLCCIPLCALTRAIRRGATDLSALDRLTYAAAALGCWSELQVPTSSPPPPPPTVCLPVSCQSPTQALQQNLNCYPLRRSSAA